MILETLKKDKTLREFIAQFIIHGECHKKCEGCNEDIDSIIETVAASVLDEIDKGVVALRKKVAEGDGSPRTVLKESVTKWIDECFWNPEKLPEAKEAI